MQFLLRTQLQSGLKLKLMHHITPFCCLDESHSFVTTISQFKIIIDQTTMAKHNKSMRTQLATAPKQNKAEHNQTQEDIIPASWPDNSGCYLLSFL